ncbi:hypothetical protein TSUD_226260 [Trifolium subterraneum]|uniref:Uncharacterized protein n=1 Tax=Trifolium subterraneum TaxID=3900 RepID=A0A2Z6N2P7_TRISU|nr:hypothetical protein TSUD_226260 [Trifolium subterraneum]
MSGAQMDPHDKMRARDVSKVARGEQAPRPAHEFGTVSPPPPPSSTNNALHTTTNNNKVVSYYRNRGKRHGQEKTAWNRHQVITKYAIVTQNMWNIKGAFKRRVKRHPNAKKLAHILGPCVQPNG